MATFQELAGEAFADLLKKHGIPIDLKDALRKSAAASKRRRKTRKNTAGKNPGKQIRKLVSADLLQALFEARAVALVGLRGAY